MMVLEKGTNCGFVSVAPTSDPAETNFILDNRAMAFKDETPSGTERITEIGVYIDNATEAADITFGIYTHNPGDNNPEELVGSGTIAKGTTSGWKKVTVSIALNGNTIYWVAVQLDNTATTTNFNFKSSSGDKLDNKESQTTLTDPWGTTDGSGELLVSVYAVYEIGNSSFSKQVNLNFG